MRARADEASLVLARMPVATFSDLEGYISRRRFDGCDGILVLVHPAIIEQPERYVALVAGLRKPVVYDKLRFARAGGLVAIEAEMASLGQYFDDQVAAVYRGVPTAALPIAAPDRYQVAINTAAAALLARPVNKRFLTRATVFARKD
jgi:hypothetical protein